MTIFDELKSVGKVLQEAGKIEQYKQILEAQQELLEMQKKIQDLERENKGLKEKLEIKKDLIFERNAYWLKKENGEKDGPFCSVCWDADGKLIRLRVDDYGSGWAYCLKCKNLANN